MTAGVFSLVGDGLQGGILHARLPTQSPLGVWRSDDGPKCDLIEKPMKASEIQPSTPFIPYFCLAKQELAVRCSVKGVMWRSLRLRGGKA